MSIWIGSACLIMWLLIIITVIQNRKEYEHGKRLALHACGALYLIAAAICFK